MRRWILCAIMGGFVAGGAFGLIVTANNRELATGLLMGLAFGAGPVLLAWWGEERP